MAEKKVIQLSDVIEINPNLYEIPENFRADMRVPARVYVSKDMFEDIQEDMSLQQLVNVATLPGIQKYALAMPDIHQGYGFPIGGVAATDINEGGIISPGGIGYDINCGVRLMAANIQERDIKPYLEKLAEKLFKAVPSGVGQAGNMRIGPDKLDKILREGSPYMLNIGIGNERDVTLCEEGGAMPGADPDMVSDHAKKRGSDQLGTLGSGNHFLEVQAVDMIYDEKIASTFGIALGQVMVMIHCGSRGLGHQVCTDHVKSMMAQVGQWGFALPDRELVCAPFLSKPGQDYFAAMAAAANFAWANRHTIAHSVRKAWQEVLGTSAHIETVYDISHNMGKREAHTVDGKVRDLLVHRKGATRAFPAGMPGIPDLYKHVGHPVFIPGTMGTASYVLVGTEKGVKEAFGSSCHGAGRRMSRIKAKKMVRETELRKELEAAGIVVRCDSDAGLAEEAPLAYKDVDSVIRVMQGSGLAKPVVRLKPIAVIKGG